MGRDRWAWLRRWWYGFDPEVQRTLQERYPPGPNCRFVTSYSSVELPEEAFVKEARPLGWRAEGWPADPEPNPQPAALVAYPCPWCGGSRTVRLRTRTTAAVILVNCQQAGCGRTTKIEDVSATWEAPAHG